MLLGHVHIQLDNTCRENKNKYVTGFCAWLVSVDRNRNGCVCEQKTNASECR